MLKLRLIAFSFFISIFISSISQATHLNCHVHKNLKKIFSQEINLDLNQKTLFFKNDLLTAYVTEKENNQFLVEAFLPQEELRFYGQGLLKQINDEVTASIWTREIILDLSCNRITNPKK